MRLTIVDGSENALRHQANLISYVVDGQLAFDAGALGRDVYFSGARRG